MGAVLSELAGIFVIGFVIFIFIAGPVAILAAGFLLPVLLPVLLVGFVVMAVVANMAKAINDWLDSL